MKVGDYITEKDYDILEYQIVYIQETNRQAKDYCVRDTSGSSLMIIREPSIFNYKVIT
tara:strand:+ start:832 stop:1005 length:174 start_codon:yes stop_codon:yes gene_type:complete